ncbi:MAG: hypothetical protein L6U99_08385 [Clostridium sp.]|nr:MAG: hypothetical protein L6U99_08385 [Clostridium sp.]
MKNLILRLPGSGTRNLFEANLKKLEMNHYLLFNVTLEIDNVATIKDLVAQKFWCFNSS